MWLWIFTAVMARSPFPTARSFLLIRWQPHDTRTPVGDESASAGVPSWLVSTIAKIWPILLAYCECFMEVFIKNDNFSHEFINIIMPLEACL
jgi:hypothetical protein